MRKAKRTSPKLPEGIRQEHDLYFLEVIAELIVKISVPDSGISKIKSIKELK